MERKEFEAKVGEIARPGHYAVSFENTHYWLKANLRKGDEHIVIETGVHFDRFRVFGEYQRDDHGQHAFGFKVIEITMADTKTAKQMEAEIQRRFRGKYLEQLGEAAKQINGRNVSIRDRAQTAAAIMEIIPNERQDRMSSTPIKIYPASIQIEEIIVWSGTSVKVVPHSLPLGKALCLIEFMKTL